MLIVQLRRVCNNGLRQQAAFYGDTLYNFLSFYFVVRNYTRSTKLGLLMFFDAALEINHKCCTAHANGWHCFILKGLIVGQQYGWFKILNELLFAKDNCFLNCFSYPFHFSNPSEVSIATLSYGIKSISVSFTYSGQSIKLRTTNCT